MLGALLMANAGALFGLPSFGEDEQVSGDATVQLLFTTSNTYDATGGGSGTIVLPAALLPSMSIRLSKSTGSDPSSGPALDTDHALTSNRIWSWVQSGAGVKEFSGTLTLKLNGVTVMTQAFSVNATVLT